MSSSTTLTAPDSTTDTTLDGVDLTADVPCEWWDSCAKPAVWVGTAVGHPHPEQRTMCRQHKRAVDRHMRTDGMECMVCNGWIEQVKWRPL
jgi:hypothetical protein